ncbi:hypothetical protein IMSAGC003_02074 [Lachnospiraceae bacterium]|nr:hypothetical protein [Acetatifactor sp.]GFH95524.1 hypothetical protein IMSAGC003_02074 [Lachnospiraceae bacterium]
MKAGSDGNYASKIKKRIALYVVLLLLIFAYIFAVGEMGLGDSRKMSDLADIVSKLIIFGGVLLVIMKLIYYRKLLKNLSKMSLELQSEPSDREKLLYEKSGGIVFEILLYFLLVVTGTAALANEVAFRVSFLVLTVSIVLKVTAYAVYSRKY